MRVQPFSYLQQKDKAPVGPVLPNINQTNLLAWYDANFAGATPSTTWEDLTGNGNNLSTVNSPSHSSTYGLSYYDLVSASSQYLTVTPSPLSTQIPDLTVTVWLYANTDYSGGSTTGRWVSMGASSPTSRFFFGSGFGSTNMGYGTSTYNPSPMTHPTVGVWEEFTVTFDYNSGAGGTKFYNNGSNYSNVNAGSGFITTTKPLHIGKQFDALGEYFNGRIAIVLIYDRVLSEAEVLDNYNAVKNTYSY